MSPPKPRYLLDTSIVVNLARRNPLSLWIEATYALSVVPVPLISMVTVGELRSLARLLDWGHHRLQYLQDIVDKLAVVPLDYPGLLDAYADIDVHSQRQGRKMGKNDLWIAATAHVTGTKLLTTDRDFDHLNGVLLDRDYIDPARHF
jgi:tRNA(fMet)-specific endonuclease VapC